MFQQLCFVSLYSLVELNLDKIESKNRLLSSMFIQRNFYFFFIVDDPSNGKWTPPGMPFLRQDVCQKYADLSTWPWILMHRCSFLFLFRSLDPSAYASYSLPTLPTHEFISLISLPPRESSSSAFNFSRTNVRDGNVVGILENVE